MLAGSYLLETCPATDFGFVSVIVTTARTVPSFFNPTV